MTKKSTAKKVKSKLAMMAFVAVFCVTIATTSFGIVGYVAHRSDQPTANQTTINQTTGAVVPLSSSLLSNISLVQGR